MTSLQPLVDAACVSPAIPGAVALVSRGGETEVAITGQRTLGGEPMTRDTVFRIASLTKPITAAATMVLVERGRLGLDESVASLLPELARPSVLRSVTGPVDEPSNLVPAKRPITVRDLLTFQAGHGMPDSFDAPIVSVLSERLGEGPPRPQQRPAPDEWMSRLAGVPMVHHPGEGWTYNLGSEILGVLLARASGRTLGEVLTDTVLGPTGMDDTAFWTDRTDRLASLYLRDGTDLELVDPPEGQWSRSPPFESGAGGLVSTVDDWHAFGRMLLAGGVHDGHRVLAEESVTAMMTSYIDGGPGHPFLGGQGWGFGGSVDIRQIDPWNVPGRYGWVGGTGTAGYVIPSSDTVVVWLTQVELRSPEDFTAMGEVLTYAADPDA
ncbi:serine hydrolase domain-containing protein [Nocardioides bizhenqiangii]|uniref:Serine hydrolase domain-containing protein n=1 Tax=Nocardioides bizhenqiangii TaxID=3095076 RepID=A0ABZ0ZVW7_9ACTN|nr:serine hydrolase domain-containing protein [Nocardioides sp. HM61]WQQ28407.1 serine hydrolase domain-containing protein [Nocardioides sp. HM61]